jgi:hypothetical protein
MSSKFENEVALLEQYNKEISLADSHLIHQPVTRTRSFISVEQLNQALTLSLLSSSCSYKQVPLAGG